MRIPFFKAALSQFVCFLLDFSNQKHKGLSIQPPQIKQTNKIQFNPIQQTINLINQSVCLSVSKS